MTPTHLSMSHEGKETLLRIVGGLEGVTPGPWLEDGRYVFIDTRGQVCCGRGVEVGCPEGGSMLECCGNPDVEGDYHTIAEGGENNIPHIARCHPDAIRAIGEYVAAVEKERDELKAAKWAEKHVDTMNDMAALRIALDGAEATIAELRAALEPFAAVAALFNDKPPIGSDDILHSWETIHGKAEITMTACVNARAALKGGA